MRKKTKEEIISEFTKVHGERYDYSQVEYVGFHSNVIIVCKAHGEFPQTPSGHLRRYGCRECGKSQSADCRRKTTAKLIEEFRKVHGDTYDYSQVVYLNARSAVKIVCKIHGPFPQIPTNHLRFHGCKKCSALERGSKRRSSTINIIEKFRDVHGDLYDYSELDFVQFDI